jgi:glycosyltransferase involved in cell wall biosynthesis
MSILVKVSVIIPTYNRGRLVCEAIDSVLNQTFSDYEIVVVDSSVDNTQKILASYGNRLQYVYQCKNGVSAARNKGILSSSGEYIAFLDDDDLWLPNKLALQVKYLDDHPDVGLLFSDTGRAKGRQLVKCDRERGFQFSRSHRGHVFAELFINNFIPCCSVIVRRTCFDKVGLFNPSYTIGEDYDMWLRIARFYIIDYIDQPLAIYRNHEQQDLHSDVEKAIESVIMLKRKLIDLNPSLFAQFEHKTMKEAYYRSYVRLGWVQMWRGDVGKARKNYRQYIQLDSSDPRIYILMMLTLLPFGLISRLKRFASRFDNL